MPLSGEDLAHGQRSIPADSAEKSIEEILRVKTLPSARTLRTANVVSLLILQKNLLKKFCV